MTQFEVSLVSFHPSELDLSRAHRSNPPPQPTDARKAFPCWDEPALKATFSLTMISASTSVNLSNMEVLEETSLDAAKTSSTIAGESQVLKTLKTEHLKTELKTEIKTELKTESTKKEEWKVTRFNKTPPMSTCESSRVSFLPSLLACSGRDE